MRPDGFALYLAAYQDGLLPDPDLHVDEWAEQYGRIPAGAGAEPGAYRVERTPYAHEVMRCLSPGHPARRVVAKVASQLFKTQVAINWVGASIHMAPGNVLVLEPTLEIAKRISKRFDKTIADIPELRARVAAPRSRHASNTMFHKAFEGGDLYVTTAGSAANLAEVPVRYIYGDEIDRWDVDVDNEGSPIDLAETRASTFGRNAKIYYTSSPTEEGASPIDDLYAQSDRREYHVPCPHCDGLQVLQWANMRYTDDLERIWYECAHCAQEIEEHHKPAMLTAGRWIAQVPGDGETVGFHLNALYSPLGWVSWKQLARQFRKASTLLERGDMEPMQVFYNTRLAMTWDVVRERVKADQIRAVAEDIPLGVAQAGCLVLTAAVDVQTDRLELLVLGWGEGMERWTVAQHVVSGSPTDAATWDRLDEMLLTPINNTHGVPLIIEAVAIDSGNWTQDVYEYARHRRRRRVGGQVLQSVLAIKGESRPGRPVIANRPSLVDVSARGRTVKSGCELWHIGTDTAKDWIYPRLLLTEGPGGIHYSSQLEDGWFDQLVAEAKRTRYVKGYKRAEWVKLKGAPNEALDLFVYNLAMAHHLELNKRPASFWERRRARLHIPNGDLFAATAPMAADGPTEHAEQPAAPPQKRRHAPTRRPQAPLIR